MGTFSDTGEHAGERGVMAAPCFLIRDGNRWMLWDTGLGDRLAAKPEGEILLGARWLVRRTLVSQLASLGLKPDDIAFVGVSHLHADHSRNVGLFTRSRILIAKSELDWSKGLPLGTDPQIIASLGGLHVETYDGDRDVFGDGRVRILFMPGHTPGHHVLLVQLPRSGAVLLSGDLYHTRENYVRSLVPIPNVNRADTLASFDRFRRIATRLKARVVVQHSLEDFEAMPAFPSYLD